MHVSKKQLKEIIKEELNLLLENQATAKKDLFNALQNTIKAVKAGHLPADVVIKLLNAAAGEVQKSVSASTKDTFADLGGGFEGGLGAASGQGAGATGRYVK